MMTSWVSGSKRWTGLQRVMLIAWYAPCEHS